MPVIMNKCAEKLTPYLHDDYYLNFEPWLLHGQKLNFSAISSLIEFDLN